MAEWLYEMYQFTNIANGQMLFLQASANFQCILRGNKKEVPANSRKPSHVPRPMSLITTLPAFYFLSLHV